MKRQRITYLDGHTGKTTYHGNVWQNVCQGIKAGSLFGFYVLVWEER